MKKLLFALMFVGFIVGISSEHAMAVGMVIYTGGDAGTKLTRLKGFLGNGTLSDISIRIRKTRDGFSIVRKYTAADGTTMTQIEKVDKLDNYLEAEEIETLKLNKMKIMPKRPRRIDYFD